MNGYELGGDAGSELLFGFCEFPNARWVDLVEISEERLFGEVTAEILAAAHKSR